MKFVIAFGFFTLLGITVALKSIELCNIYENELNKRKDSTNDACPLLYSHRCGKKLCAKNVQICQEYKHIDESLNSALHKHLSLSTQFSPNSRFNHFGFKNINIKEHLFSKCFHII